MPHDHDGPPPGTPGGTTPHPHGRPHDHAPLSGSAPVDTRGPARRGVSRRSFIQTLGISVAAGSIGAKAQAMAASGEDAPQAPPAGPTILGPDPFDLTLTINGRAMTASVEPGATLLQVLRIGHGLTGAKDICDRGSCGGCSVLIDGKLIVSCMMLAADAAGSEITTVEGLGSGDPEHGGRLDPVQEAFIRHDGLQCGFCTPGLVMATRCLLNDIPRPTLPQIKHGLAGNICRCGTYTNIFNAALEASGQNPLADAPASKRGA